MPKGRIWPGFSLKFTLFGKSRSALNNGLLNKVEASIFSFHVFVSEASNGASISQTPLGEYHPPSVTSYLHDTNGGLSWSKGTSIVSRKGVSGA